MASRRWHKRRHCQSSTCTAQKCKESKLVRENNRIRVKVEEILHQQHVAAGTLMTAQGFQEEEGTESLSGSKILKRGRCWQLSNCGVIKLCIPQSCEGSTAVQWKKIILKGTPSKAENCRSHLSSYSSKNSARDLKSRKLRHIKSCRH